MSEEVEKKAPETDATEEPDQKSSEVVTDDKSSGEKVLDELTSIEREIAIMHDAAEETSQDNDCLYVEGGLVKKSDEKVSPVSQTDGVEDEDASSHSNGIRQIERKNGGSVVNSVSELSDSTDLSATPDGNKAASEDQLEHDDLLAVLKGTDDKEEHIETGVTIEGEGEFQIVDIIDNEDVTETDPLAAKETPKREPLTKEEEHKLALEQWHSLKSKNRRRKQDIKSITQPADLVTSLVSDWSDGDEANTDDSPVVPPLPKKKIITSTVQVKVAQMPKAVQEGAKVLVVKETDKPVISSSTNAAKKVPTTTQSQITAAQPKKIINSTPPERKTPVIPPPSPFKRTRIIKRKIIWDPDAPETQFSYAKLVKPVAQPPAKKDTTKKDRATPVPTKKKEEQTTVSPAVSPAPIKRLTETPTPVNGSKKKKFSEIDRLLGDEGAVNMLNSLEGERTKRSAELEASRVTSRKVVAVTSSSTPERSQTPQKKEIAQPKRRTPKPKASSSWDYVYKQQNDDSMIIRRRSNSSYSSNASVNRLSVDTPVSNSKSNRATPRTTPKTPQTSPISTTPTSGTKAPDSSGQFEFAKPENKSKSKKVKSPVILVNQLSVDLKKTTTKRSAKSPVTTDNGSNDGSDLEDVTVTNIGGVRQVAFNTQRSKLGNTFTVQLLNDLTQVLDDLNEDNECNVVLMISDGPNFCQGIDFTDMALGALEKRKNAAVAMARAVKNFLVALASFRKPLVAGVNGVNSGLGVTMLPLFDVVIGSDKGVYEMPYARIGQIPEGYFIFSESSKVRSTFKTKLIWLAEKLHSTESALSGLVNKLTSANKVNEEALICARKIASLSPEAYSAMKKRSIEHILPNIITSLEEEEEILVRQWCSASCVENFKHFIHKGQW